MDYFPPGVTKFNAYSIHGTDNDRIYEVLFPVPGPFPDFHRLELFQLIDFNRLRPDNDSADLSEVWKSALQKNREKLEWILQEFCYNQTKYLELAPQQQPAVFM